MTARGTSARLMLRVAIAAAMWIALSSPLLAKNGAFRSTAHGDRDKGVQRRNDIQRGSCAQCHVAHSSAGATHDGAGLFAANDNALCFTCHNLPSESGAFPGSMTWQRSVHATSPQVIRGGANPRAAEDVNLCVNCHNAHGVADRDGVIPAMLEEREGTLCLDCHDGSRGPDIRAELTKASVHGSQARGTHDPHEKGDPSSFAASPRNNRHVACSDCHNVHVVTDRRLPPDPPSASPLLAGVARVQVSNGPAGTVPQYTWRGADDTTPANEYEICFKCHSSWTKQPAGATDLALVTNPANPSFHPIQAAGKNTNIDPRAFVPGYGADTRVTCTSCHGSDDQNVRGPHGSAYPYLLRRPLTLAESPIPIAQDELCFSCHAYAVYASATADASTQAASRFNAPSSGGHVLHVGIQHIPCYSCHDSHGSTRFPALIARGRMPGMTNFMQTADGGTCMSSCHAPKTYQVNYSR